MILSIDPRIEMPTRIGPCPGKCCRDLWLWTSEEIKVIETDRLHHEETRYQKNRGQYVAVHGVKAFDVMDQYPVMLRLGYARISALSIANDYNAWWL